MVDPKFGTKRVCEACGGKFYDLNKNPVVCPLCGHSFDPNAASTPVAPVAEVAPVQDPPEKDDDETPKDENEISLDDIVEEDGDDGETSLPNLTMGPYWLTMKKMTTCWKMRQAMTSLSKAMTRTNRVADHAAPSR